MKRALLSTFVLVVAACAGRPEQPVAPGKAYDVTPTHRVAPQYPAEAAAKGIEGCVLASFYVSDLGLPDDIRILDSQPPGVFDGAALQSLAQWRFKGDKGPGRYAQRLDFRIDGADEFQSRPRCKEGPSFEQLNRPITSADPAQRSVTAMVHPMPKYGRSGNPEESGGCVAVSFVVLPEGTVGDVTILSAKPETLGPLTVEALKQWRFVPFDPPQVTVSQTFQFTPELVKLPDNAIRGPLAVLTAGGGIASEPCGTTAGKS